MLYHFVFPPVMRDSVCSPTGPQQDRYVIEIFAHFRGINWNLVLVVIFVFLTHGRASFHKVKTLFLAHFSCKCSISQDCKLLFCVIVCICFPPVCHLSFQFAYKDCFLNATFSCKIHKFSIQNIIVLLQTQSSKGY